MPGRIRARALWNESGLAVSDNRQADFVPEKKDKIVNINMLIILILMITNFIWFLTKILELFLYKRKPFLIIALFLHKRWIFKLERDSL